MFLCMYSYIYIPTRYKYLLLLTLIKFHSLYIPLLYVYIRYPDALVITKMKMLRVLYVTYKYNIMFLRWAMKVAENCYYVEMKRQKKINIYTRIVTRFFIPEKIHDITFTI